MEFDGEFVVDSSPEDVWPYFTDPEILQDAAPGCKEITMLSPSRARATVEVGVGSVKPSFEVEAIVTECDRPHRLEVEASGEASRNSFWVQAWQELEDNGDGTTTVHWGATAEVSGIIASLGQRAIQSVTDKLVDEFFRDIQRHVDAGTPAEAKFEAAEEAGGNPTVDRALGGGVLTELLPKAGDLFDRSRAPGTVLGGIAVLLWVRTVLRGDRGRRHWWYLVIGVLLGIAGKSLWDQRTRTAVDSVESPAETQDDEPSEPEMESADEPADEPEEASTPDEGMIDDPLDRLS